MTRSAWRQSLLVLLLALGFCLWLISDRDTPTSLEVIFGLVAFLICAVPSVNGSISRTLDRIREIPLKRRVFASISIAVIAIVYIYLTSIEQGRSFRMILHDEFMFRLQSQMLARGRLWMPPHPLGDFFEMFYVLNRPVYAPIYYPGAAIMSVPGIWMHLPAWVTPLLLSGIAVGLTFDVVSELLDGAIGFLAAVLVIATPHFRRVSLLNLAQQPELVLGLAVIALWLRWRRRPSLWLEISIGVCAGWATITRPIDAICFVAPIFLAMLVRELRLRPRRVGMTFITCVVGAAPLIGLQLFFDRGVTGHWLTTPVSVCLARDLPGLNYGLRTPDRSLRPQTHLAQKIVFYDSAILPQIQREQQHNRIVNWYHEFGGGLPAIGLPVALLVVLIPSSLLVLWRRPAVCVLLAPLILYLVLYPMYPFFAAHYLFVIIPLCAALVAMGVHGIAQTAEPNRAAFVETILFTIVLAMSIASLPELNRRLLDQSPEHFATLRTIEAKIDALPRVPSIVLFHYDPRRDNPHEEPMHNTDSAWPDDELIIRAHDLGARNHELFDYFAKREPSRRVYLCDQEDATIRYLGMVGELARAN